MTLDEQARCIDAGRVWAAEKAGRALRLSPAQVRGLARLLREPSIDFTAIMKGADHDDE